MKVRPIVVALMLAASAGAAQAGQSCEQKPLTPQALQRGLELARQTQAALDAAVHRQAQQHTQCQQRGQHVGHQFAGDALLHRQPLGHLHAQRLR